ncbi:MAG: DNA photolyase [Deltaproteobacteria bacterium]|nr:DNA photolyase [Deltaproteobacteria bacterium]
MLSSKKSCFANPFSHIYIEHAIRHHPTTLRIINGLPRATILEIASYKHIFNRGKQNFELQKKSPKLILAQKQPPFVYPFSQNCQQAGFKQAVYVTPALGCRFNCDFCFLHGMYNSANLVVFVNTEDVFAELNAILNSSPSSPLLSPTGDHCPLFVSISYETDLIALESICGLAGDWIEFCRQHPNVFVECRTRSGQIKQLSSPPSPGNFLLAWSLNPDEVIRRYEHGAPGLEKRLTAVDAALSEGWPVRICFDPILPGPGFEKRYSQLFETVFSRIPADSLFDVTAGPFRMGKDFFKRIRRQRPWCDLFYPSENVDSTTTYSAILQRLCDFVPEGKLVVWE